MTARSHSVVKITWKDHLYLKRSAGGSSTAVEQAVAQAH